MAKQRHLRGTSTTPVTVERQRTPAFETPDLVSWLHDAANLIRNIDLCTHLLVSPDLDAETRRSVQHSALRTIAVLKDMFPGLRRPARRSGTRTRHAECELHEAVHSSADLLTQQARRANVTIEIVPAPELLFVRGDRGTYQRLIYNLMLNALEASVHGGRVVAKVTSTKSHLALAVGDTGSGMSRSVRRRLFKEPVSTKRKGSGRGLLHAAATVAALGGTIAIDSQPGTGTTVTLRFPVSRRKRREARSRVARQAP